MKHGRGDSSGMTGRRLCATGTRSRCSAATRSSGAKKTTTARSSRVSCASIRRPCFRRPSSNASRRRFSGSQASAMQSMSRSRNAQSRVCRTPNCGSARMQDIACRGNSRRRSLHDCASSSKVRAMTQTWHKLHDFEDIKYERTDDGIAKITINRPEVRNAFRPATVRELKDAFDMARDDENIGVVILTGEGPEAFCSGGDQRVRGKGGYVDPKEKIPRLNILDVQKQIRSLPKPVVAMVAGYAIGGGHVLHVVCDLTIAAENARFGQTGPRVGSFDAGLGSVYLSRIIGQKKAREIWYLCRQYDAKQALDMGLINTVVPRVSARPARASARSTPASARSICRASSARKKRARSGSSAANTMHRKRCRWDSSTRSFRSSSSRPRR